MSASTPPSFRESERRLRTNGYLIDARIRPVAYADGKVDLEVLTQDTWTLKPRFGFGTTTRILAGGCCRARS